MDWSLLKKEAGALVLCDLHFFWCRFSVSQRDGGQRTSVDSDLSLVLKTEEGGANRVFVVPGSENWVDRPLLRVVEATSRGGCSR